MQTVQQNRTVDYVALLILFVSYALFNFLQVAKNLANTYGDKAPEVAKLAALTGRRWPVLGQQQYSQVFF